MIARAVNQAADVIHRAQANGAQTAVGIAIALESAQLLVSPELAHEAAAVEAERDALKARVAELELERHSTNEALDDAVQTLRADRDGTAGLEAAQAPGETYPPALPWAALMDHEDLTDFLDELAASAITHASSEVALAEIEATCGRWRLIAEAQHAHNTAPGQLDEWCTGCNADHDPAECGYRPATGGAR